MSDELELTVERVVPGGEGLARDGGVVVLVDGGLPGDRVRAAVLARGPRLLRARTIEVLSAGPFRRDPARICPSAADRSCGGCDWPAARLSSHRELKSALVRDAFRRVGKLTEGEIPELGWRGSSRGYRLRNRLHWDGAGALGFFAPGSNRVATPVTCELVSASLLERIPALLDALRAAPPGELSTLEGRTGAPGSPILGAFRPDAPVADPAGLAGRLRGALDGALVEGVTGGVAALDGPTSLDIEAGGASFRVSVTSFFQGNRFLLDAFLEEIAAAVSAVPNLRRGIDLYAGAGFLTHPLIAAGADASAVEIDPSSFADLEANVSRWKANGKAARAVRSTAERFLGSRGRDADLVVADPPRAGLSPAVRGALLANPPAFLLLVSCDPVTLARDLAALRPRFAIRKGTLLDLFPQTHHVETLLLLARK